VSGIGLALAAVSAVAKLKAGQAQAAQYQYAGSALLSQAKYTRFKGKQDSLKYKKQAVDELEKILARMAHTSAAAGAGNMDPFTGNPFGLKIQALSVGGDNYATADGNRAITVGFGNAQADLQIMQATQMFDAATSAYQQGVFGALMTMGKGFFDFYEVGGFGGFGKTIVNPGSPIGGGLPKINYGGLNKQITESNWTY